MFFSGITQNLNWEILNEDLFTFKRWDGDKNERFYYLGGSQKNLIAGCHEKPIYKRELLKRGACTVFRFKGGWQIREGVLLRGREG